MLNKVILIGRLTKDPELRFTPSGTATSKFILAVNRGFKNQNGEEEADFIPIMTWKRLAEICSENLAKGNMVAVEGRIQTRNYENNEGKRVWMTEVVAERVRFLERKKNNQDAAAGRSENQAEDYSYADDNLPF